MPCCRRVPGRVGAAGSSPEDAGMEEIGATWLGDVEGAEDPGAWAEVELPDGCVAGAGCSRASNCNSQPTGVGTVAPAWWDVTMGEPLAPGGTRGSVAWMPRGDANTVEGRTRSEVDAPMESATAVAVGVDPGVVPTPVASKITGTDYKLG